jgi:hypothetical protein
MPDPTMEQLQEQLAQLKGELETIKNPKPEDENLMMREARSGPAVRDYIPPELADRFPELAAGVGRPDFIPDERWLAKKHRSRITRFQEEYGMDADPTKPPPVKKKVAPYLNPITGEREVMSKGEKIRRTLAAKKASAALEEIEAVEEAEDGDTDQQLHEG